MTCEDRQTARIFMFGPLRLQQGGRFCSLNLTGNTRDLLAYLLLKSKTASRREELVAAFWPDSSATKGRSALTTALWRIKKLLTRFPDLHLTCFDDLVMLETGVYVEIDGQDLQTQVVRARQQMNDSGRIDVATRRALAATVERCCGEFLDGCGAMWALVERERFASLYLSGLTLLMRDAEARGAFDSALTYGRTILAKDPLHEAVHHQLMALYAKTGERRRAILQYEQLRESLQQELGVAPDRKTEELRNRILAGDTLAVQHNAQPLHRTPAPVTQL